MVIRGFGLGWTKSEDEEEEEDEDDEEEKPFGSGASRLLASSPSDSPKDARKKQSKSIERKTRRTQQTKAHTDRVCWDDRRLLHERASAFHILIDKLVEDETTVGGENNEHRHGREKSLKKKTRKKEMRGETGKGTDQIKMQCDAYIGFLLITASHISVDGRGHRVGKIKNDAHRVSRIHI
jgi:hypothetical protein